MHYFTVELVVHLYSEICLWHCAHDLVLFEKVFAVPPCSVKDLIKFQSQLFSFQASPPGCHLSSSGNGGSLKLMNQIKAEGGALSKLKARKNCEKETTL